MARALGLDSCDFDGDMSRRRSSTSSRTPYRRGCWRMIHLLLLRPDAVLLELASPPGGFDAGRREALPAGASAPGCRESMLHTPRRSL